MGQYYRMEEAMATEAQLRSVLILIFEKLREQNETISILLSEVGALRDSLCEIGPQYDSVLTRHRLLHDRVAKPLAYEADMRYAEIVEKLRNDSLA
jgi:hypothetical protein